MIKRRYPLPRPDADDPRFSFGLAYDVAGMMTEHGYPELTGQDFAELQSALYGFLYETPAATS